MAEPQLRRRPLRRLDPPRLEQARRHRLLARLARLLRLEPRRRRARLRQPRPQHAEPRREGADAVDPLSEPPPRRGGRRRGRPRRTREGLRARARRLLRPDGGGPRAVRLPLRDRPARPRRRPRGGVDRLRRDRQRPRRQGEAHARRHLGRARRDGLENAPGARRRRGHLRRHVRRRGLPRPDRRRLLVPGALREEARDEGLRGDDEVPLRPEVRDGRDVRRQLRDGEGAPDGVQLPLAGPSGERANGPLGAARRPALPRAVQRGDDREAPAVDLRRAVRRRLQEAARRVQEGLRAVPDDGAALRRLRPARGRAPERSGRRRGVRRDLGRRRPRGSWRASSRAS